MAAPGDLSPRWRSRRRRRRSSDRGGWEEDAGTEDRRRRRKRKASRAWDERRKGQGPELQAGSKRRETNTTCQQCAHLVTTRSFTKMAGESWDSAVIFPTLTCFQQGWTLEDPDSVEDPSEVSTYLTEKADECPTFRRGRPVDPTLGGGWDR